MGYCCKTDGQTQTEGTVDDDTLVSVYSSATAPSCSVSTSTEATPTNLSNTNPAPRTNQQKQRRKTFSQLSMNYKRTLTAKLSKEMIDAPILNGFSVADKASLVAETAEKLTRQRVSFKCEAACLTLLKTFMEALRRSKGRKGREDYVKLLSLLFETFTLKELNQLLSAADIRISQYHWRMAHLHLVKYRAGLTRTSRFKRSNTRVRVSTIQKAVSFAKSPMFYKPNSYGTHRRKFSNSTQVVLPTFTRLKDKKKIFSFCKARCLSRRSIFIIFLMLSAIEMILFYLH